MRKDKNNENFQLSYESDGDMGMVEPKEEKIDEKPKDFFNITQDSE